MDSSTHRQQVLFLYLEHSGLDGRVVGWSFHDGGATDEPMDAGEPPYALGVDALRDGWRLLQASPVPQRVPGAERTTGRLEHKFLFERLVPVEEGGR